MITPFRYARPDSIDAALQLLRDDVDAKLLAGGQSLLASMKLGLAMPSMLIDLAHIPALTRIARAANGLWIGAMCTHAAIATSAEVRAVAPMLADLASHIGDQQVRNRGTIGGSVANDDPAADWPAGLLAGQAVVHTDRRQIPIDHFFLSMFSTALEPDELIVGFQVPAMPAGSATYLKIEQPASRFALTGVAMVRRGPQVRIAVTGLGHGVIRVPAHEAALGSHFSLGSLDGPNPVILDPAEAVGDLHAGADYRAHLADVLIRRAVGILQS